MTKYLISFPSSAMAHIPDDDFADAAVAARAVVRAAKDEGVWIFSGGVAEDVAPVMVTADGSVAEGTYPETKQFNGGYTILDLRSREAALEWAAKIAEACRCDQEVREFMPDPDVGN